MRDAAAASSLVSRWQTYTPRVRDAVLTTLVSEERLVFVLLDAVARGDVSAAAVGPSRWQRLRAHRNPSIRQRAETLSESAGGTAMQNYERKLKDVTALAGNAIRGEPIFTRYCSACHTSGGTGGHVGPDLSGVRNQPADALLLHIVVPDYEIAPGYEAYTVETRDGRTIFGRLESDAPNSVTLRDAAGQAHTILRTDVKAMTAGTSSLMPAGLDQMMTAQDLADLIAYLKRLQQP
jgi:putative heme-binding domain-containing protein